MMGDSQSITSIYTAKLAASAITAAQITSQITSRPPSWGNEPEAVERSTPFRGYRNWHVEVDCRVPDIVRWFGWIPWVRRWAKNQVRLKSPVYTTYWEGPILRADEKPDWTYMGHGIYAASARHSKRLVSPYAISSGWWFEVLGEVELMGKVIEHKRGYRGEVARITWLCVPPEMPKYVIEALRERFQCDVDQMTEEGGLK